MPLVTIAGLSPARRPLVMSLLLLCGAAAAISAGAASAAPAADDVPRQVVQYSSASLATDSGAREVYRRLVKAADRVCPTTSIDYPLVSTAVSECRKHALARAVQDIHNSRLAALHDARTRRG